MLLLYVLKPRIALTVTGKSVFRPNVIKKRKSRVLWVDWMAEVFCGLRLLKTNLKLGQFGTGQAKSIDLRPWKRGYSEVCLMETLSHRIHLWRQFIQSSSTQCGYPSGQHLSVLGNFLNWFMGNRMSLLNFWNVWKSLFVN